MVLRILFYNCVCFPVGWDHKLLRLRLFLGLFTAFLHLLFEVGFLNLIALYFGPNRLVVVAPKRGHFFIFLEVVSADYTDYGGYGFLGLLTLSLSVRSLDFDLLLSHHPQVFLIFLDFGLLSDHLLKLKFHHLEGRHIALRRLRIGAFLTLLINGLM